MYRVLFCECGKDLASDECLGFFPTDLAKELKDAPDKTKKERVGAYALLSFAIDKYFGKRLSDLVLKKSEGGKPYLLTREGAPVKIYFNISHSNGFAALIVGDEGEVGIDIEGEVEARRAERLAERYAEFLPESEGIEHSLSFEPEALIMSDGGLPCPDCEPIVYEVKSPLSFEARWTLLEACLKCDGGGFGSVKSARDLYSELETGAKIIISKNKKISISIAKCKQ